MYNKKRYTDLAMFGGTPLFEEIKSTSNLIQPAEKIFFKYAKLSFDSHCLSNDGPIVKLLESRLAGIHEVENCVTFCNGLWGIVIALKCLALKDKKEIIMPSLTYRRMADIAAWLNLVPRFCEISEKTLGVTRSTIEEKLTSDTAIILAPHPIVNLCDIDGISQLSKEMGIPVLFDAVEAAHAVYNGHAVGSFGNAECFSMHASKFLNGFEGGYATTNDNILAEKLRAMRNFGFHSEDNIEGLGMNAKLNEIHAAMTLASVDEIEEQIEKNKERYDIYKKELKGVGLELVAYSENEVRTFKNILVAITNEWPFSREKTLSLLHSENMLARPYYSPALHQKKADYKVIAEGLNLTEKLSEKYMLLPSGDFLTLGDVKKICNFLVYLKNEAEIIIPQLKRSFPDEN